MARRPKSTPAPELVSGPIATTGNGRDITRPWLAELEQPRDPRLLQAVDWGVYDRILLDDQVQSTFQQRRAAVTSREWEVVPGDESAPSKAAAEALKQDLQRIGFDRLTDKMLFSRFHGYAVAEMGWVYRDGRYTWGRIWVRHARRFRYDKEGVLRLLTRSAPNGEKLPDGKFWVLTSGASDDDEPYGRGLAEWLYWPTFFKRNGIRSWMIFLDKFGAPTAIGKYRPGTPAADIQKLLGALQAIATDSGIAVPEGMAVELLEAARSGTSSYAEMARYMDGAISKVVLSQTMTTDDGSSNSQAQVHGGVKLEVVKSDADLFCDSFNEGPVTFWHGFNYGAGVAQPRVIRKVEEEQDLKVTAETDAVLDAMGWERTEESFKGIYGDGYQRKVAPSAAAATPVPGGNVVPIGAKPAASPATGAASAPAFAALDPRPLYVQRKVINATAILDHARRQGIENLITPDDLHVTIAYSRQPVVWTKIGQAAWSSPEAPGGKLLVPAGGPRLVDRFTADGPVVLLFASNDLQWRHREIRDAGASWDHNGYHPHLTLSYAPGAIDVAAVEPWRGLIELGPEIFEPINEDWKSRYDVPAFAEAGAGLPAARDDIDAIAQAMADEGWQKVLGPMVDPLIAAMQTADSYDAAIAALTPALAAMDAKKLEELLRRAGFVVELAGRIGADQPAGNSVSDA